MNELNSSANDHPFFSVILPTYNRAHLLGRAINSVVAQDFQSWELIVVDDGSTDDTKNVVESFRDKRIKYIFQQNQERSAARNTGIRNAGGQYICFLDSDDYYLNNHLSSFFIAIKSKDFPIGLFYSDTYEENYKNELIKVSGYPLQSGNPIEWVVQESLGCPRTCLHSDIFKQLQFNPKITVGEDVELWVRVFKHFPVYYSNAATVVFVSHADRTVDIGNEASCRKHIELIKQIIYNDSEGYISRYVRKKILSDAWFRLARHYIFRADTGKALRSLVRSFLIFPSYRLKEKIFLGLSQLPLIRQIMRMMGYSV